MILLFWHKRGRGRAKLQHKQSEILSHLFIQEFKGEVGVDDCNCWKVFIVHFGGRGRWNRIGALLFFLSQVRVEGEMQICCQSCDNWRAGECWEEIQEATNTADYSQQQDKKVHTTCFKRQWKENDFLLYFLDLILCPNRHQNVKNASILSLISWNMERFSDEFTVKFTF